MEYITVKEAAERWNISVRRVRMLCNDKRVDGAVRQGWSWLIPDEATKPIDGRSLRSVKPLRFRIGFQDYAQVRDKKRKLKRIDEEVYKDCFFKMLSLILLIEEKNLSEDDIKDIIYNFNYDKFDFKTTTLVLNAQRVLYEVLENTGDLSLRYMQILYSDLTKNLQMQEVDLLENENMQSLILQYDRDFQSLDPVVKACAIFSEVQRISPFLEYNKSIAYLLLLVSLINSKYLFTLFDKNEIDQLYASLSMSASGDYQQLVAFTLSSLSATYELFLLEK